MNKCFQPIDFEHISLACMSAHSRQFGREHKHRFLPRNNRDTWKLLVSFSLSRSFRTRKWKDERERERMREKQEQSSTTTTYKLSGKINGQLHHIQPVFFLEPSPTEMSAVNMSMMMVGLVIATICLLNASGEEEKVGTWRRAQFFSTISSDWFLSDAKAAHSSSTCRITDRKWSPRALLSIFFFVLMRLDRITKTSLIVVNNWLTKEFITLMNKLSRTNWTVWLCFSCFRNVHWTPCLARISSRK